jgi:hypothetical protein
MFHLSNNVSISKCSLSSLNIELNINYQKCIYTGPQYIAKDTLHTWHENFHPWLQLNNVQRNTSNNIRVTVIPFYMGRQVSLIVHVEFSSLYILQYSPLYKISPSAIKKWSY